MSRTLARPAAKIPDAAVDLRESSKLRPLNSGQLQRPLRSVVLRGLRKLRPLRSVVLRGLRKLRPPRSVVLRGLNPTSY